MAPRLLKPGSVGLATVRGRQIQEVRWWAWRQFGRVITHKTASKLVDKLADQ